MSNPKERERLTCQAERDYDSMKEEKLLESALTPDDHRDESEWRDFLETKVSYYSNALLDKAIDDLLTERSERTSTTPKDWGGAVEAVEIHHALQALLNKESIF